MNESVKKLQDKDREQKSMCADAMRSLIHSVDLRMAYEALALAFRFHIAVDSNSQQPLTLPSMVSMVSMLGIRDKCIPRKLQTLCANIPPGRFFLRRAKTHHESFSGRG
jgi:hypothetical protein